MTITNNLKTFEDAFNMLCGDLLGEGMSRKVFECKLLPEMVVKVEYDDFRRFQNIKECEFWDYNSHVKNIAKWLAPCHFLSPDGRILIQSKVQPVRKGELPIKIPSFLTDLKPSNFGIYEGRIVACDYGLTINNPSLRMKKANWSYCDE